MTSVTGNDGYKTCVLCEKLLTCDSCNTDYGCRGVTAIDM